MNTKINTLNLKEMKGRGEKIVALTCYSYSMARIMSQADVDMVLVGDTLGMVELGYKNTIPVTVEEMLHHLRAVRRADLKGLLVVDMPFMSYNLAAVETLRHAGKLVKEGSAEAVKIEGGRIVVDTVRLLVNNNIPVMGHLGLMPQSIHKMGGYKVQGDTEQDAKRILEEAKMLEEAGIFSLVLEGIPHELAHDITSQVSVPTIGIGAGPYCDGQILVVNDMLGMDLSFNPKFVRRYAQMERDILIAFQEYSKDVKAGRFPSEEESY